MHPNNGGLNSVLWIYRTKICTVSEFTRFDYKYFLLVSWILEIVQYQKMWNNQLSRPQAKYSVQISAKVALSLGNVLLLI